MKLIIPLFVIYELSFAQYEPTRLPIMGPHGQDCTPPNDDNPPNNCAAGQSLTAPSGKIECSENFDCCLCESIRCGYSRNIYDNSIIFCDEFHVNGDSGAFGVQKIDIRGSADTGAAIICGGDNSCNGTSIRGTNIGRVSCAGDHACAQSRWNLTCLEDKPCPVGCVGDNACSGTLDNGAVTTAFEIGNSAGLHCSDEACINGIFVLDSNIGGGSIWCDGELACNNAQIVISNIDGINCGGMNACKDAFIQVTDPKQDFSLNCKAMGACQYLELEIIITKKSSVDFFKSFSCAGFESCQGAMITITNWSENNISLENMECGAHNSCNGATIKIINKRKNVEPVFIEHIKCNGMDSCKDALFENVDVHDIMCSISGCDGCTVRTANGVHQDVSSTTIIPCINV